MAFWTRNRVGPPFSRHWGKTPDPKPSGKPKAEGRKPKGKPCAAEVQSHGLQNGAVLSVFDQHPTDRGGGSGDGALGCEMGS